jgi:two-component system, LuxR family, response regulator FixJ
VARREEKQERMKTRGTQSPTVFVVDDDADIRAAVALLMKSVKLPVRTFAGADEFLSKWDPGDAGCLVLDVRMPGMSGLELQNVLRERNADIPVVFLSGHGDIPMALRAVRAGAVDFIEKPFRDQPLIDAVHEALAQDEARREGRSERESLLNRVGALTSRERQVAELVASGRSSPEIAKALKLSSRTVEMHRARAMRRLGVEGVVELTRFILEARRASRSEGTAPVPPSPKGRRRGAQG